MPAHKRLTFISTMSAKSILLKQQLSAPGGKTPEKESVLKKLEEAKAAQSQKKVEQKNHTQEL